MFLTPLTSVCISVEGILAILGNRRPTTFTHHLLMFATQFVIKSNQSTMGNDVSITANAASSPVAAPSKGSGGGGGGEEESYSSSVPGCDGTTQGGSPPRSPPRPDEWGESLFVGSFAPNMVLEDSDAHIVDVDQISTQRLAQHHLYLGTMCLAYARRRDDNTALATEDIVSTDLELLQDDSLAPLEDRPYPPE